ncbi:MAG: type II toxin-antitoxin system HipA family toxin [Bacteroidia bacterium]|nr:type II toxin-antitoxin system HipA family toxin [Bacteroidia bacterium]
MEELLKVTLWGREVAATIWDTESEFATIEFYDTYADSGWDISPLMMPLGDIRRGERQFSFPAHRGKTFKGLPGLLADSLPDDYGNSLIDEWFAAKGMKVSATPLDRLCYIGKRGMGALEYQPATKIAGLDDSSGIEIEKLTELARQILNQREQFSVNLNKTNKTFLDILRVGTSAGGAKPKAIIAINEKTGEVRSGQVNAPDGFTYWLLKFDGVEGGKIKDNPAGIGKIEYAYYKMAIASGIRMTECRLLPEGDHAHFMTKRFDRTNSGEKLHVQTLCAIAHFDRDERYSYEQIFQTMRRLYLPYADMEQMFRRMVFNVIARNQDDHTKNHSFIMNRSGEWSLAPAYDVCYAYSPSGQWTNRHQLSLNNKRDYFTLSDMIAVAEKADITYARQILQEITETVSRWKHYAREAQVNPKHIDVIDKALRVNLPYNN